MKLIRTGLDIIERPVATTENVLWSETSRHIMVSGSWDATVKVWSVMVDSGETVSINREPLAELFDADSSVVCLPASTVNGGVAIPAPDARMEALSFGFATMTEVSSRNLSFTADPNVILPGS